MTRKLILPLCLILLLTGCQSPNGTDIKDEELKNQVSNKIEEKEKSTLSDLAKKTLSKSPEKQIEEEEMKMHMKLDVLIQSFEKAYADVQVNDVEILADIENLKNITQLEVVKSSYAKQRDLHVRFFEHIDAIMTDFIETIDALNEETDSMDVMVYVVQFRMSREEDEERLRLMKKTTEDYFNAQIALIDYIMTHQDNFTIDTGQIAFDTILTMKEYEKVLNKIVATEESFNAAREEYMERWSI